jgi:CRISPR/Cas system-associated exonuclease Cas4 (RecB family)
MGRRIEDINDYIGESVKNIRDDRSITSSLLTDLLIEMKKSSDIENHKELGLIASKYVETLQRSNEQLVKITAILNKRQDNSIELNEEDKEELFDLIQSSGTGEK